MKTTLLRFFALSLLLLTAQVHAQNNISYTAVYYSPHVSSFYFTGGFGSVMYSGDLGSFAGPRKSHFLFKGLQYNLSAGYQITNYVSLRLDWSSHKHTSPDYLADSLRFGSFVAGRNTDFSINLVHDLTQKANIDAGDKLYSPYVLGGIGFARHKKGELVEQDSPDTFSYPALENEEKEAGKMGIILPFGAGIRYYVRHNVNVALEVRSAVDLSDMYDRVSNRADPKTKDKYILYGFRCTWSRSYKFNYQHYRKRQYKGRG